MRDPDRKHIKCPKCGKEPRKGQTHCILDARGIHCFVCGHHEKPKPDFVFNETPAPARERHDPRDFTTAAHKATQHPRKLAAWDRYKRLTEKTISEKWLGVGVLPLSRCQHERLTVPLFEHGRVVGVRGRAISCDCGKWLSPAGNTAVLYGIDDLPTAAPMVFIVENAVDRLVLKERGIHALATLSVSYWFDHYTAALLEKKPRFVMVAYDNDAPGNATNPRILDEWRKKYNSEPPQRGAKLVDRLRKAGLTAGLYQWPNDAPHKADVGSLL